MNYDPNLTSSGRMARQTVALTFQQWEFKKTYEVVVEGNCTGMDVVEGALDLCVEHHLPMANNVFFIELVDDNNEVLTCEDEFDYGIRWLKEMLVKAEIIDISQK